MIEEKARRLFLGVGGERVRVRGSRARPLTFTEPQPMRDAALDGTGTAHLLEYEAAPHLNAGKLVKLRAKCAAPFPGFFLYYPSRQQMRRVFEAFPGMQRHSQKPIHLSSKIEGLQPTSRPADRATGLIAVRL